MAEVADLWVMLRAETTPFRAGMAEAAASGESFSAKMGGLGGALTKLGKATTAVGIGVAVTSVKMASDFQAATVRLVTSAGETHDKLGLVQSGLLSMAGQVGVSATDLAKAMYYVEAAGYHASDGLTVLKAAAQGAAAEGADTTTVAQALTDVLKDYHLSASAAGDVTSKMIAAVAHGKVSLQDFSAAFASIVPAASAAGISFNDVGAALAEMTNHGFTAQRASQNLAQALRSLLNPTKPMQAAFQEFGVSADELKAKLHGPNGLTDAMQYLSQAATKAGKEGTPEFAAALKRLMGTAPGANAALTTVGANFKDTAATIRAMAGATTDAQGRVSGFALVQKNFGQQVKQLRAGLDSLMIELGMKLIPVIQSGISFFTQYQGAAVALATVIGVVLTAAVVKFATGAVMGAVTGVQEIGTALVGAGRAVMAFAASERVAAIASGLLTAAQAALDVVLDANPIVLIVLAVIAFVAALIYAYMHCQTFRNVVAAAFEGVKVAAVAVWHALQAAWNGLVVGVQWLWHAIQSAWQSIEAATMSVWNAIAGFFRKWWPLLLVIFALPLAVLIGIWNHFHAQITATAHAVWNAVAAFFAAVWDGIKAVAQSVWSVIQTVIIRPMQAAGQFLLSLWRSVSNWLSSVWASIRATASSLWSSIRSSMTGPITSAWQTIVSTMSRISSAISGGLRSALNAVRSVGSWFVGVGSAIVSGIVSGVESAAGGLFSSLRSLASSALSAAKSALGIGSPSRLFAEQVGQWIPHGVAAGIRTHTRAAVDAVTAMGAQLASAPVAAPRVTGAALAGASAGPAGGPAVTVTITVQGSVLSERDLRDVVQEQMLRLGMRSSTSYTPYKR